MMSKYIIGFILFFILSISQSTELDDEYFYYDQSESTESNSGLITSRADWNCWGDSGQKWYPATRGDAFLVTNTDVCVTQDVRPMLVDVYLKNIIISDMGYNTSIFEVTVKATHNLTKASQTIKLVQRDGFVRNKMIRFEFPAIRSADYSIVVESIVMKIGVGTKLSAEFEISGVNRRAGSAKITPKFSNAAIINLIEDAKSNILKSGKPAQINFAGDYEIPMKVFDPNNGSYTSANLSTLLILPFSYKDKQYAIPHLLGDTHTGDAARCESNSNAIVNDGTLQKAELYTLTQAWEKMNNPVVLVNANYFDTRPQKNNTTWQNSLCSTPLGIYFDNTPDSPTNGTHNSPNVFFPGPKNFISTNGSQVPLDALFWTTNRNSTIDIFYSENATDPRLEEHAAELAELGYQFVAIAGAGIPIRANSPEPSPDSGARSTTRTAIGISDDRELIYIFQGGDYKNGVNRLDLNYLFYALGVSHAIELDGGGSSSSAIKNSEFTIRGAAQPQTQCPELKDVWCSAPTDSSGKYRPVPSWLGLALN